MGPELALGFIPLIKLFLIRNYFEFEPISYFTGARVYHGDNAMVPRTPPVSGTTLNNPTQGPVNPTPPTTTPVTPTSSYRLVSVQLGAALANGSQPLTDLRVILQPTEGFRAGLSFGSNFSDRHDIRAQAGYSLRASDLLRIDFMGEAGLGFLNNQATQQGTWQESITLNGVQWYLGGTVRLEAHPTEVFGFYVQASVLATLRDGLTATPDHSRFDRSANVHPNGVEIIPSAGILFNFGGRSGSTRREEQREDSPRTQSAAQATTQQIVDAALAHQQAENDRLINDLQAEMVATLQAAEQERVRSAIDNAQTSVNQLSARVSQVSSGINAVDRLVQLWTRITDINSLSDTDRTALTQSLDELQQALGTNNSTLLMGLRYNYHADSTGPRYYNAVIAQLTALESSLRSRHEETLANRVHQVKAQCERFGRENTENINAATLQAEINRVDAAFTALEQVIGRENLSQDPRWQNIQRNLNANKNEVNLMYRSTLVYNNFRTALSAANGTFFGFAGDARESQRHFTEALNMLRGMTTTPTTQGVTLDHVKRYFGNFVLITLYNLNSIIQQHRTQRPWAAAVQAARNLACYLDAQATACTGHSAEASTTSDSAVTAPVVDTGAGRRTPPNPQAEITRLQAAARTAATQARADARAAESLLNTVPADNSQRSALQNLVTEITQAANDAEAARDATIAAGTSLAAARQQNSTAQEVARTAHQKLEQLRRDVAAALRTTTPTPSPVPVVVAPITTPPPPPPPPPAVRDAGPAPTDASRAPTIQGGDRTGARPGTVNAGDLAE